MNNREAYLRGFRDAYLIAARFYIAPEAKDSHGVAALTALLQSCYDDRATRVGFVEHLLADGGKREAA